MWIYIFRIVYVCVRVQKGEARLLCSLSDFPSLPKSCPTVRRRWVIASFRLGPWDLLASSCREAQIWSGLCRSGKERYEAYKQHFIGFLFNLSSEELPVHLEKHCLIKCYSLWLYVLGHRDQECTEIHLTPCHRLKRSLMALFSDMTQIQTSLICIWLQRSR